MTKAKTNMQRITRSAYTLSVIISRNMLKPNRCKYCVNLKIFGEPGLCPCGDESYGDCQRSIRQWLEKEAR